MMILVTAPAEVRVMRIALRDGIAREDVLKRMKHQWNDEEKMKLSQYVIVNDGKELLLPQVISIHEKLSKKS